MQFPLRASLNCEKSTTLRCHGMENDEKKYGDIDRIGWQTRYGKKKIYNKWLLGESNSPFNFNTRIYAINSLE